MSIGIQVLGALEYPSGWDEFPQSVDTARERLWDWSDCELSRCVKKSKAYQALFGPVELPGPLGAQLHPSRRPSRSMAGGFLERVGCERIDGWAWDEQQPDTPIAVEIYDGATCSMTVTADRLRSDLVAARKGNGRHSFVVTDAPFAQRRPDARDPRQDRGMGNRAGKVSAIARSARMRDR